ncbi:MAG: aldo/keto reductase, partial [Bacteroidia bacterium]|nr:aldo/keto reductase [Bacteroidia bacterium]
MKKTNRREFLQKSVAGLAGLTILSKGVYGSVNSTAPEMIDMVKLGNTGINVPRVALGTGSGGW